MGNVPTKLDQDQTPSRKNGRSLSTSSAAVASGTNTVRSRRATSLVGNLLNANSRSRANSGHHNGNPYKRKSVKEKEKLKEMHTIQLLVKYDESVDGGFLAPYGCYNFDKLDYDAEIVKKLIVERKLAPFYTPLQDFDDSWTREEVIKIVDGLPLHATFNEELEEFDDVPVGDLGRDDFDYLIDRTLSKKEQRRLRSKVFNARLYKKRIIWQERENEKFLEHKLEARKNRNEQTNKFLPSDDLKYSLYKNGTECPICFLYFPEPMNYSRCCLQPICTECFVQIKRLEPHFPHDEEVDPTKAQQSDEEKDPNLLISEPSNCPYCATPNFGVTYDHPVTRRIGVQGLAPSSFVLEDTNDTPSASSVRRGSIPAVDPLVVTSDSIRPDWEIKLNKERMRLARRSANATAIHVSNQLVDPDHPSQSRHGSFSSTNSRTLMSPGSGITPASRPSISELENKMIEQAIRLSLLEEENKKKGRSSNR